MRLLLLVARHGSARRCRVVESVVYRGVRDGSKLPRLARDYFCAALVAEGAEADPERTSRRFLDAAWACDDAGAAAQARICRERAAEMLRLAIATGELEPPREVALAILADLERRAVASTERSTRATRRSGRSQMSPMTTRARRQRP